MISNWLSAALTRRNIHYGWVMVGVTFLTALITAGTAGRPRRQAAGCDGRDHHQQGLRFRHEGHHAGA